MKSLSFFSLFLLIACNPSDSQRVEAAEKDVFALHDSIMPRMGDLLKTKKQLRQQLARLDSLTGSPTELIQIDEQKTQVRRLYARVDEADSLMMSWMENYNSDTLKALSATAGLNYLADQKTKINHVNQKVNASLAQSRAFLAQ